MGKAEALLQIAAEQVGYREGTNNDTKFGAWYGMNFQPWCAMFVSWCADRCGLMGTAIPRFAYVPDGVEFFRRQGRYFPRAGYTPVPGDLVFFGESDHVGLVEAVTADTVCTIEGNTGPEGGGSEGVWRRKRPRSSGWIMGYGHPQYEPEPAVRELEIRDLDRQRLVRVRAVNLAGWNYIRLRDLEKLFPVKVDFDEENRQPTLAWNYEGK